MKKISSLILKYWYAYVIAIIAMIISVSLDMLSPFVTKYIIDDVIIGGNINLLTKLLIMVLLIGLGRAIFQYIKEIIFDMVSSKIATDLRKQLFEHIQGLSLSFFDKNNTGELMSRVKDDIDNIWNAIGFVGMLLIEVVIHTSLALFFMFRLSTKLTIIPLIAMPTVAALAIIMQRHLGKIYEQISEENAKLNTVAQENIAGSRTVKAYAKEDFEIKKFFSRNKRYYNLNMQQSKVFIKYYPLFQFVSKLVPLLIIIFGGNEVIRGNITLGDLGAYVEYSMNIVWPMEMLGWLTNDFSSAVASNKKINAIYEQTSEIANNNSPLVLDNVNGHINFNNVSLQLGDKEILHDISFDLKPGKTLGIMGSTGSGKTSIINVLQRFYNITKGEITLDSININDLSLNQLRNNISVVNQDVFLFSTTISNNIKLGDANNINDDDIIKSVDQAKAKDFIESMNNKYKTIIGERGVGLSGGQKQRISIARTLSKKTPVIVLDDSTSALDTETEFSIQESLDRIDATKIIIAHRISAVKNADEIIILNNGKITERGTHDSLLEQKGYYYQTYISQYANMNEEVVLCR
ncbi:MAG TPA: ABC transporter ATP-binding protein [Clostridiales bacterium]|nr:ABC transporter ATP-binding protein [Clostridiales bacterium]